VWCKVIEITCVANKVTVRKSSRPRQWMAVTSSGMSTNEAKAYRDSAMEGDTIDENGVLQQGEGELFQREKQRRGQGAKK